MTGNQLSDVEQLIEQGRFVDAETHLYRILRFDTQSTEPLAALATLQRRVGRLKPALGLFETVLELDPQNTTALRNSEELRAALKSAGEQSPIAAHPHPSPPPSTPLARRPPAFSPGQSVQVGSLKFQLLRDPFWRNREDLIRAYWLCHPRFKFFKTVPLNTKLLDIGASSGGLAFWKAEPLPMERHDIELYAIDLAKGVFFDRYVDYQIGNLDTDGIKYANNFFDAVLMSHVLEHLRHPDQILGEINRVMRHGGQFYVEVPSLNSLEAPERALFLEQGIDITTVNFFDDKTHKLTYDLRILCELLEDHGFKVLEMGMIENQYLQDALIDYGVRHHDPEVITYGVWSRVNFAEYALGIKS